MRKILLFLIIGFVLFSLKTYALPSDCANVSNDIPTYLADDTLTYGSYRGNLIEANYNITLNWVKLSIGVTHYRFLPL